MRISRIATTCALLTAGVACLAAANPFKATPGWGDIGREWGSTSAVYTTADGNIYGAEVGPQQIVKYERRR